MGRYPLEDQVRARIPALRRAHPGVVLDDDAFIAHVARVLPEMRATPDAFEALALDDLFLGCASALGDARAIAEIERVHLARARAAVARFAVADEAMQKTREALFVRGKIAEYGGRGDLAKWIRTIAMRAAMDLLAPQKEIAVGNHDDRLVAVTDGDPQIELMKREYGAKFKEAMGEGIAALPDDARAVLRVYYLDGRGLEELAEAEGVAASTISRRLAKARASLLAETRRALLAKLRVGEEELDSILRLIETRLDLTRSAFDDEGT